MKAKYDYKMTVRKANAALDEFMQLKEEMTTFTGRQMRLLHNAISTIMADYEREKKKNERS